MLTDHQLRHLCKFPFYVALDIIKEQGGELTETYEGLELETVSLTIKLEDGSTTEAVCFPQYGKFYYEI